MTSETKSIRHHKMFFDNQAWVKEHAKHMDKEDATKTLSYVIKNHPYKGLPYKSIGEFDYDIDSDSSLEECSLAADAVTVFCYEKLGNDMLAKKEVIDLKDANQQAIGNVAYIAQYHSSEKVKAMTKEFIDDWRSGLQKGITITVGDYVFALRKGVLNRRKVSRKDNIKLEDVVNNMLLGHNTYTYRGSVDDIRLEEKGIGIRYKGQKEWFHEHMDGTISGYDIIKPACSIQ